MEGSAITNLFFFSSAGTFHMAGKKHNFITTLLKVVYMPGEGSAFRKQ